MKIQRISAYLALGTFAVTSCVSSDHASKSDRSFQAQNESIMYIAKSDNLVNKAPLTQREIAYYTSTIVSHSGVEVFFSRDSEGGLIIPDKYTIPTPIDINEDIIITIE